MLNNRQKAAAYNSSARSCAELAPWLHPYNDQVIVDKDTGLLACFEFEGLDTDSVTVGQLNSQAGIAEYANKIFADKPITVWWTVDRKRTTYYPGGEFPDEISQEIDDSRRAMFAKGNNRINTHTLAVLMVPNVGADRFMSRLRRLMMLEDGISYWKAGMEALKSFASDKQAFAYSDDELVTAVDRFEELLASFTGAFSNTVRFTRFAGDALATHLSKSFCDSYSDAQENVALPEHWFLDSYLPDAYVTPGHDFLEFSGSRTAFAKVLTIKSFPQPQGETETRGYTVPGMLDKLMTVPGDIKFTQVFRYASKSASMKHMKTVRRYNDIAKHGWKGMLAGAIKGSMDGVKVNSGRAKDNTQIEDAEGNLSVDQGTTGWYNCTVICYGDTLEHACDLAEIVESTIRGVKFIPFPEKEHCLSAWAGTIPGQHGEIVRWLFLDNANVANLMPLRTVSRGQIVNEYLTAQLGIPCPPLAVMSTDYGTPFYYVHYVMHIGHKLFMGPSRTGKTTLANYLWTAFRKYLRARVITFDIDYSTRVPILLQDGKYIDLGDESSQRPKLNPLVLLKEGKHLGYLVRFVKLLCEMRGYSVNASQEVEIEHALLATRSLAEGDPAMLRLLTVYTQITDHLLQEQLQLWVGERPYAKYFDNVEDHFDLNEASSLLGLETRTILRDEMIAVPFMDLAFHRIQSQMSEEREKGLIVPTVIYIPECWYFLKNKQFANQIENYLKTIARYASSLWMDTQSPDELMVSGVFGSMRDNIKTVVYAPNKKAKSASLYKIYATEFGLSDSQIMRIADAQAQRDYFIKQDDLSRMVQPCFDKETIAMLGSDRRAQVTFDRHYRNGHPEHPNWKQNYVNEMLNKTREREAV